MVKFEGQPYLLLQVICLFLPPFHLYNSLIVICFVLATVQETVYKTCYLSLQLTPHLCLCFPSLLSLAEPWSFSVVCPLFSVSLSTPPTRKHDQNFNHKKRPQFHVPFKKEQGALLPSHDSFKYCQTSSNAQPTCLTDLPPLFLLSYFCDLPIHSNLALAPTASINILWHISPIDFHLSNSVNFFFFTLHLTWPHQHLAFLNTSFVKPSSLLPHDTTSPSILSVFFLVYFFIIESAYSIPISSLVPRVSFIVEGNLGSCMSLL